MAEHSKPVEAGAAPARRLTLSQIVELLLTRSHGERSTVTIARDSRGQTSLEVTVRTGESDGANTVEEAEAKARAVFDRLRETYPPSAGHDNGDVTLTRNAKGETQVAVSVKTSPDGIAELERASEAARAEYDTLRSRYPMADGTTAKPGSVA